MQGFCYSFLAMSIAEAMRNRVEAAKPGTLFTPADFEGSPSAIETALSRMVNGGLLKRVRKGLYWKGVESRFGSGSPGAIEVAVKLSRNKGIGPAGWTASHALGLTTQVPVITDITVVGSHAPAAPANIRFHTRNNLDRVNLRFHEIAILEVLRDWPRTVDSSWAVFRENVDHLAKSGLVNVDRITRTANGEPPNVRRLVSLLAA